MSLFYFLEHLISLLDMLCSVKPTNQTHICEWSCYYCLLEILRHIIACIVNWVIECISVVLYHSLKQNYICTKYFRLWYAFTSYTILWCVCIINIIYVCESIFWSVSFLFLSLSLSLSKHTLYSHHAHTQTVTDLWPSESNKIYNNRLKKSFI